MPAIERVLVRRPLKFRKNLEPSMVADNVVWRLHRNGNISFPDFGEKNKRPKVLVEILAYIRPMFAVKGIEIKAGEVVFSTKANLIPHIHADGKHVFFQLDGNWLYITRGGYTQLLAQLAVLCPKAYRDILRLRPLVR